MSDDDLDFGFDDDESISVPTMRGNANLDPQDYARGPHGRSSSFLDDDLQEDTPSTPGQNPGAADAPDIDGDGNWSIIDADDGPGMRQTTFGAHPWGPGGATGYRPAAMQRTDMALRDTLLREEHLGDVDMSRKPKRAEQDSMHDEPEVANAVRVPEARWTGNRNQQPSNAGIPRDMLWDDSSYEYDDSSQNVIGNGIFSMEEGTTWRPRDGIFADQYALPAYIGDEDELGVQQSEMFDTTANNWRVTQPSAGGVSLKARVPVLKPGYSPFVKGSPPPEMRPEVTGPRSHIEAFGRRAASLLVAEAKTHSPATRSAFLANATEALGPGASARAAATAKKLVEMGRPSESALEDSLAHAVMHATAEDLKGARLGGSLPRLDKLASRVSRSKTAMQASAAKHIAPLASDSGKLKSDLGAFYGSPAMAGVGQVAPASEPTLFTTRNVLIGLVLAGGGYLAWQNRKSIQRNAKRLAKKVGL